MNRELQHNFSAAHGHAVYNSEGRRKKAQKTIAVLQDHFGSLNDKAALDIGCAAGLSSKWYAQSVQSLVAIDIDTPAVSYAQQHNDEENLTFAIMDSQRIGCRDESFDIVICNHIYEHVPDARELMAEIHRVLRPGGACFFGAGNRLSLMEPHYHLPLLSVVPKFMAHWYLSLAGRGSHYYETHFTYWGLRKLVASFELIDYTESVVRDPKRFNADDVIKEGSRLQSVYLKIFRIAYWACPTYVWLLKKPADGDPALSG